MQQSVLNGHGHLMSLDRAGTGIHDHLALGPPLVADPPSRGVVTLAASLLPGFGLTELEQELREIAGPEPVITFDRYEPSPAAVDKGMLETLKAVLSEADPGSVTVPMLFPSPTDGRHFARLGIQTYGFLPMKLPSDFAFAELAHGTDERIPADAVTFGTDAVYHVLQQYGRK